ncbi:holin [Prescottella equi]|uniref:holin n=1 Tax=Rhodococcus hoagii TaxID=43767 RepID=UPI002575CCB6|nr:holin [Prescottella equi]WJJ10369.1 holin [Prescottella equi]
MASTDPTIKTGVHPSATLAVDARAFWLDVLDRASRTFLQTVLLFLTAGATVVDISWFSALSSAALAAFVSVLMAVSTAAAISSGNFLIDLADRAGRTFAATLVGAITATGTDIYHFSIAAVAWREVLLLAFTASLVSVVTSLSTANLGISKGVPSLAPVLPSPLVGSESPDSEVADRADRDRYGNLIDPETRG